MSDIEARARSAAAHWNLTVGHGLAGGSRSTVFAVTDAGGRDLVLKLPPAPVGGHDVTAAEAAALTAWAGTDAAVTLVDALPDALLLVRARPGVQRPWRPDEPIQETVGVARELLGRLWAAHPGPYRYRMLAQDFPESERVARQDAAVEQRRRQEPDRGEPGLRRLTSAAAAAEQLIVSAPAVTLLHGDFVSKNLVSDAASPAGWVALDPRPMVGDAAAEVAVFAAYHPADVILPIAEALARVVAVDLRRTLSWAAIWTVHQAAQAWRSDQQTLENLVESRLLNDLLRG